MKLPKLLEREARSDQASRPPEVRDALHFMSRREALEIDPKNETLRNLGSIRYNELTITRHIGVLRMPTERNQTVESSQ